MKEIEEGRFTEPPPAAASDSNSTTPNEKERPLAPWPIDTPHNTVAVKSHVAAVLDELDSLVVQGIFYNHTALRTNTNFRPRV